MIGSRILDRFLRELPSGELEVVWPEGPPTVYRGELPDPSATLVIRDLTMVRRLALRGTIGFAEAYMDEQWDTPDLVALLELLAGSPGVGGPTRKRVPLRPLHRLTHLARANTRRGARRNISYHYDLGNDFYSLWLDPTMTYSCGLFPETADATATAAGCDVVGQADVALADRTPAGDRAHDGSGPAEPLPGSALEAAQRAKWEALLSVIDPRPGDRMLEIGSGWGGFAIHAARTRGCEVVGITLSQEQLDHATTAAAEAGVQGSVEFRLQDYRDVRDRFDHVASIEMFEAVGERYWNAFFARLREVLRPGGRAGIQVITIDHARFGAYRTRPDFTQTYIFPGGMLPSLDVFLAEARAVGLTPEVHRKMGSSYARTLSCWLQSFEAATTSVRSLGFDERFIRMWRFYLAYCIAGFRRGMIDVAQVRLI